MNLAALADLCRGLERTGSRLAKTRLTAEFLRRLAPDEVPWAVAFLTGRPFPASDPRVLEVSWATLAGLVELVGPPPGTPTLTLEDVARGFETVAAARGPGSRTRKAEGVVQLFGRGTAAERDVLRKIVHGEMRIGLHEGLLQDAIAAAAEVDAKLVRRALLFVSDPAVVARTALTGGAPGLQQIGPRLFVPLLPMLAEPSPDITDVLRPHRPPMALEFKYDGARIQLHKAGAHVRIWSRRLTEVTTSLPEIAEAARQTLAPQPLILDGEVVAVGRDGRPLPFQELMRRFRRVHEVAGSAQEVPLALYLFDCLLVDGRSLIDEPYETRWATLEDVTGGAHLARRTIATDEGTARAFLAEALASGHEGLIAKAVTSRYTPGSRGTQWLKIKSAETIDCVIVAADRGSGRRRRWLSNYHLAVRDASGGFVPVGKTFKGLTDREFAAMTSRLWELQVADDGYTVSVRPEVVVEVTFNEIQRSPQYRSRLALRFARITRIRPDKAPQQTTALSEVEGLYERQFGTKSRRDLD